MSIKLSRTEIRNELWRRGCLEFKMHSIQKEMFDLYENAGPRSTQVWLLSRQTGKSYCLTLIALMEAIRKPNSIIKLMTDTKIHVQMIFEPLFREILEDCPDDVRPNYIPSKFIYEFPNGSQIQMAGTDGGNAERLRGQKSSLILVDEAGSCTKLNYNVLSILLPTTTHTGGKLILASTPPEEPDHDFVQFIEQAEQENCLTKKTLFDNPLLSDFDKESIVSRFPGGRNNTQFRREYMCELIRDESRTIIPEFDESTQKEIVKDYPKPPFYTPYVSMDLGFKDFTVVLFGYYDFKADKIIIEDEIAIRGKDLKLNTFTERILEKEQSLWLNVYTNEQIKPQVRVSDIDYIVINEINRQSKGLLNFQAIKKEPGYKLPLINQVRIQIQTGKIIINPRCETLIRHLRNARWKDASNKDDFARSPDDGHYDAIDALLYFVKSITYNKNPYPANYAGNGDNTFHNNGEYGYKPKNQGKSAIEIYESIFGKKKRY
jgi:PBSX family phage terminase large subunit